MNNILTQKKSHLKWDGKSNRESTEFFTCQYNNKVTE
jgi:hypothetical protein